MNVVRCKGGHFFDADSYERCPHCGEAVADAPIETPEAPKSEKRGFRILGWAKEISGSRARGRAEEPAAPAFEKEVTDSGNTPTDFLPAFDVAPEVPVSEEKDVPIKRGTTLDFWQTAAHGEADMSETSEEPQATVNREEVGEAPVCEAPQASPVPQSAPTPVVAVPTPSEEVKRSVDSDKTDCFPATSEAGSLKEAVQKATASREGKTMSYFSVAAAPDSDGASFSEPTVGWLVAIGGKHLGETFSIFAGKNSIGRGTDNRIVIARDNAISREKHALIVYEPKKRRFYLQPGDSSGLTYLNDDYISDQKQLCAKDVIELGDSKFLFIPLCGEDFTWEDYMPKE